MATKNPFPEERGLPACEPYLPHALASDASELAPASRRTGCCGFAGPGPPPLWIRLCFFFSPARERRKNIALSRVAEGPARRSHSNRSCGTLVLIPTHRSQERAEDKVRTLVSPFPLGRGFLLPCSCTINWISASLPAAFSSSASAGSARQQLSRSPARGWGRSG